MCQLITTIENKIFKLLLVSNLIGIILDISSMIIIPLQKYDTLSLIVNKMYLIYFLIFNSILIIVNKLFE